MNRHFSNDINTKASLPFPEWKFLLIFFIPVFGALGPYFLPFKIFGVNFFALRMLVLIALYFTFLTNHNRGLRIDNHAKIFFLLGAIWIFWGIMTCFWVTDQDNAIKESLIICFGFLITLSLFQLQANTRIGMQYLLKGWLLGYICAAIIAVWEFTTGNHLESYTLENKPDYFITRIVFSTFASPNNYAAFLLLSFPFLSLCLRMPSRTFRMLSIFSLASLPLIMVLTESRICFLGLIVQIFLFVVLQAKLKKLVRVLILIAIFCFGSVLFYSEFGDNLSSKYLGTLSDTSATSSVGSRKNLTLNGLELLYRSYGFGSGAGSFHEEMEYGHNLLETGGIVNPHNFFIEILSQYGVVVFLLFVFWYINTFKIAIKSYNLLKYGYKHTFAFDLSKMLILSLTGYLFAAVANSSYMPESSNWVFLASIVVIASYIQYYLASKIIINKSTIPNISYNILQ